MDITKLAVIGIIGAILSVTVKDYRPELAGAVSIATGVLILIGVLECLGGVFSDMEAIISKTGIQYEYVKAVIKLIGISYIIKFASEICRDCGQNAIAAKIELAGKVSVLILTLPIINSFLELVIEALYTI